ncbi:MAG: hypothetical protein COX77_02460 [Candidatus Komeilibacteria bacterium CG_4_10_14_0_2_um_filter_37_10]|uniref:Uncharacterized protein n=1 Tax=Candidatus Komeilibacteria bacterium CG_4_10_14_0_2_um_filter_37_10 TaxID=1974470 RepID=A0A2M7VEZ8_9BACT|nr:MAG: hypothetical protein COX77_02460 [Candidatus Komeilibacteria bacterium CG_4_10_14_0_2_um_filter_37_10]
MNNDFYSQFAWELLSKAELLTNDQKDDEEFANRLAQELAKHMSLRVAQELSSIDLDEYVKKVSANAPAAELHSFLQTKIVDFDSQREKWLTDFSYNFLERTARSKQAL